MGFGNVHDVEGNVMLVLLVKFVERGNLPAKRRSSVAAEDEDNRTNTAKGRKRDGSRSISQGQSEIWRGIARVQPPLPCILPHRLEWKDKERNWPCVRHEPRKTVRRLAHRKREAREREQIQRQRAGGNSPETASHAEFLYTVFPEPVSSISRAW
jgi:hypothetical protein